MGQPVAVTEKPTSTPGTVRFETNRCLTGMGHERFRSDAEVVGVTPSAELARRMFATGRVNGIHVFSNMITVDLAKGFDSDGLQGIVGNLYQYWKPGMVQPSFEDLVEAPTDDSSAAVGAADSGGSAAMSEATKRVPAHLLERSRLARDKWKARSAG